MIDGDNEGDDTKSFICHCEGKDKDGFQPTQQFKIIQFQLFDITDTDRISGGYQHQS